MSGRARGALAGLALAALGALGASGGASDDMFSKGEVRAMFEGCLGGMVGSLEAIASEFPGFRAGEVRMNLAAIKAAHEAAARADWADVEIDKTAFEVLGLMCTASDDVAEILGELRDGSRIVAGMMWRRWRWDGAR